MSHARRGPLPVKMPVLRPMDPAVMAVTVEEQRRMLERFKYTEEDMLAAINEIHATYKYTEEQMLEAIKGGLDEGWRGGWRAGMTEMLKCAYAAISVVMREQYGFGAERLLRLLKAVDMRIETTIEHSDLLKELEKAGVELDLSDPLDRISIRGKGRGRKRENQNQA